MKISVSNLWKGLDNKFFPIYFVVFGWDGSEIVIILFNIKLGLKIKK